MKNLLSSLITPKDRNDFKEFIALLNQQEGKFLLRNDIIMMFRHYCDLNKKPQRFREKSSLFNFIKKIQEFFFLEEHIVILHRHAMARYRFYLLRNDGEYMEEIDHARHVFSKEKDIIGKQICVNHPLRKVARPFFFQRAKFLADFVEQALGRELPAEHHNLAWPPSFPSARPLLALDRVYARGAKVLDIHAHATAAARRASDHLPVIARIGLPAPRP